MKKNFLRKFLILLISQQFYFSYTWAQELPIDPPAAKPPVETPVSDPIDTPVSEPTDPVLPPELINIELSEVDSKAMFDVLNKWNLVVTDRQTKAKTIKTSDVICVENLEEGRRVGCSLYDELRSRDITKYNKFADPLFKLMVKHTSMDCEDDSETCVAAAEKLNCMFSANKYSCNVESFIPQLKPKLKNGDLK